MTRNQHHDDIGQELREPHIGEAHWIVSCRVNVPANRNIQHLRPDRIGRSNGDKAAKIRAVTQQLHERELGRIFRRHQCRPPFSGPNPSRPDRTGSARAIIMSMVSVSRADGCAFSAAGRNYDTIELSQKSPR